MLLPVTRKVIAKNRPRRHPLAVLMLSTKRSGHHHVKGPSGAGCLADHLGRNISQADGGPRAEDAGGWTITIAILLNSLTLLTIAAVAEMLLRT